MRLGGQRMGALTKTVESDDRIGRVLLEKLEVIRRIGGGGMGAVYEVKHLLTGHRRALKVVRREFADKPRFMARLLREAAVAGTLQTPYVVETLDAGRLDDGAAYVLMELLEGQSLLDLIRKTGHLDSRMVAWIVVQVCEGLSVAHRAGIIHRDMKPENVFLSRAPGGAEQVKILDFGISRFPESAETVPTRLTAEGSILGTPFYMSPEQAAGRQLDERSDIYSLGVMMYEALTGRLPFEATQMGELFLKIGAGECAPVSHYRPDLDKRLVTVVHKAFHRDIGRRHPSADELREALLPFAEDHSALQTVPSDNSSPLSNDSRVTVAYADGRDTPEHNFADTIIGPSSFATNPERRHRIQRVFERIRTRGSLVLLGLAVVVALALAVPLLLSRGARDEPVISGPNVNVGTAALEPNDFQASPTRAHGEDARGAIDSKAGAQTEPGGEEQAVDAGARVVDGNARPQIPARKPKRSHRRARRAGLESNPY